MKQLVFFLALTCTKVGFSQDTVRHRVAVTYSDNGQLADAVNTVYFSAIPYSGLRQSLFRVNATYSFQGRKGIEYGLQWGYGQRRDQYPHGGGTDVLVARQDYHSLTPFALKTWEFDRLHISTGGGIPLNGISEFRSSDNDYQGQPSRTTFEGGFAVGLNSITQLRLFLTERLCLTSSVQFGWMYARLGGTFARKPVDPNYQAVWELEEERIHRKTFFTQPEFFFGIGFRL